MTVRRLRWLFVALHSAVVVVSSHYLPRPETSAERLAFAAFVAFLFALGRSSERLDR